mmetsp:Transcript_51086/g.119592  ORF Transcript_51086/g.119592 Transcript_51086/m.119592 type:complete len:703 (+) Transcript_51086:105-2213(+)
MDMTPGVHLTVSARDLASPSGLRIEVNSREGPSKQLHVSRAADSRDFDVPCQAFLGLDARPQDVSTIISPLIEALVAGQSSALILFGPEHASKMAMLPPDGAPAEDSLLTLMGEALFTTFEEMSAHGNVCIVEASCLEVGGPESLCDMQPGGAQTLKIAQDPLHTKAYVCEDLRRTSIETPQALLGVFTAAIQKHRSQDQARCKDLVLSIHFESLSIGEDMDGPDEVKGKLCIVELAAQRLRGALLQDGWAALGLAAAVDQGSSALAKLLVDAVGAPDPCIRVCANISAEAALADESWAALQVARRLLGLPRTADEQTPVQATPTPTAESSTGAGGQQAVPSAMSQQPPSNSTPAAAEPSTAAGAYSADQLRAALGGMPRSMEAMRDEFLQQMKDEMERTRSSWDNQQLQKSIERGTALAQGHKHTKVVQDRAQLDAMDVRFHEAVAAKRTMETQAMELRAQVAAMEERVRWLQEQEQELVRARPEIEQQRKDLHSRGAEQEAKVATAELELQKARAIVEVKRGEISRLSDEMARQREALNPERAEQTRRHTELIKQIEDLEHELKTTKHSARCEQESSSSQSQLHCAPLKEEVERLEHARTKEEQEARKMEEDLSAKQEDISKLKRAADTIQNERTSAEKKYQEEMEQGTFREKELFDLLEQLHKEMEILMNKDDEATRKEYSEDQANLADIRAIVERQLR